MRKQIPYILFLLAAVCILSSCTPAEFDKPLSDGKDAVIDRDLIGMWKGEKDDVDCYLVFGASDETKQMDLICVGNEKGKGADAMTFTAFPTYSKKNRYLNIRKAVQISPENFGDNKIKYSDTYHIAKYEIHRNNLKLWYLDDDAVNEAIKKGMLQGTLNGQKGTLADSTENILKFLDNTDKCGEYEVFAYFGEFKRGN
ncbi:MAG: hypothetical protein FJ264_12745 [Planctomycetes bacterium]|nr:hypothetical protein [Planctomycetota bacterium]